MNWLNQASWRRWTALALGALALPLLASAVLAGTADHATVVARLRHDLGYLASDELEGRGITTRGVIKAADHIRAQFKEAGLKSGMPNGSYFQYFDVWMDARLDEPNTTMKLRGPGGKELSLVVGKDFQPLAKGSNGDFNAPVVFAGYGITAPEYRYDDYRNLDVAGKVVLVLRREPQQGDKNSVFNGRQESVHAGLLPKISNAVAHKAKAILFVTDPFTTPDSAKDHLFGARALSFDHPAPIPVAHVTQRVANELLASSPLKSLKDVEAAIDRDLKPRTQELAGWSAEAKITFKRRSAHVANVVGVVEGEGPHADETIVLGAHYDHLGYGEFGSLGGRSVHGQIHNGADDNASGTTTLIEMARRFGQREKKPARRMVFIAFSAEESGLLGSRYYVKDNPLFPLKQTVAMVNFDMVGRLRKATDMVQGKKVETEYDALILNGIKSAKEFEPLAKKINEKYKFRLSEDISVSGASDHASFYAVNIPVYFFFTGIHREYHRPTDKADTINYEGMAKIADYSEELIDGLLALAQRPQFAKEAPANPHAGLRPQGEGREIASKGDAPAMAYLGTIPDYATKVEGVRIDDVAPGSPAQKAGLRGGDIIVEMGGAKIANLEQMSEVLRSRKPGDELNVTVLRGEQRKALPVTLGRRSR